MTADVQWWARLARDVRAASRGELPVEAPLRAVRDELGFACAALVSGSKQRTATVNLGYPPDMLGYLTTTYRWKCPIHQRAARLGLPLRICREPEPGPLTGRELDVVGLVARGWPNERISAALGIAVRTVRSHVESSLVKLDCPNRTALARHALEHDLDTLGALEASSREW